MILFVRENTHKEYYWKEINILIILKYYLLG